LFIFFLFKQIVSYVYVGHTHPTSFYNVFCISYNKNLIIEIKILENSLYFEYKCLRFDF
jgi:hypothetical protein